MNKFHQISKVILWPCFSIVIFWLMFFPLFMRDLKWATFVVLLLWGAVFLWLDTQNKNDDETDRDSDG